MVEIERESRLEGLIAPVVETLGLEIYDVEVTSQRGRPLLRVTLERPGRPVPGEGVTIDELVEANREISAMLDVEDPIQGRYRLDVESPGVERRLRQRRHFEAALGEEVHVVLRMQVDDRSVLDGLVDSVEEHAVVIAHGESRWRAPLSAIKSAHVVYDWKKKSSKR